MKGKKILSGFLALGMVMTTLTSMIPSVSATKGPEGMIYIGGTVLASEQYLCNDLSTVWDGEREVGVRDCIGYFSDYGELTLGGKAIITEMRKESMWGAIGGITGASDLSIRLLRGSEIILNAEYYSGIYGNYEPILIHGKGQMIINASESSEAGILIYGKDQTVDYNSTGLTITDGANVEITAKKGIVLDNGADGDIVISNGATLTINATEQAVSKKPVITDDMLVMVGNDEETAFVWDRVSDITTYKYLKIESRQTEICTVGEDIAYAVFDDAEASCMNIDAIVPSDNPIIEEQNGVKGWKLLPGSYPNSYIRCNIDESVFYQLEGTCSPVVEVEYYDGGYGGFCIYYDSRNGKKGEFVQLENTETWRTKSFRLYDAYFGNGVWTDDFWISVNREDVMGISRAPVLINSVRVIKNRKAAPFNISVSTGKTGNIFFEGDSVKFNIEYENITLNNYTFKAKYIVKNYDGNIIKIYDSNISAEPSASDKIILNDINNIPYGVYTLEIVATGSNVSQTYSTDFSYSRSANEVNYHFGTNIHYDDASFSKDDIKNLSDLIEYCGFGFVRSPIRWNVVETSKGNYQIPDNIKYANEYINKIGLEMLAIVYNQNNLYDVPPYYLESSQQKEAFSNYCKYVATELKDYTDYYCMLNEFNHDSTGYYQNQQEYVDIAKAGYEGIMAGNSNAFINGGSLAGSLPAWANVAIQKGLFNYCDSFSCHVYYHTNEPEDPYMYNAETALTKVVKNADEKKQSWITESGWPTRIANKDSNESQNVDVAKKMDSSTEIEQAKWYARNMAINGDKSRIDKFFFYSFNDNGIDKFNIQSNFGILRSKNYSTPFAAKPAFITVCAFNDIIGEGDFIENVIADGTGYGNKYCRKDGREVICLWASENQSGGIFTYKTEAPYILVYDMYGNSQYIENTTGEYDISYGNEPVYISYAYGIPQIPLPSEGPDTTTQPLPTPSPSESPNYIPEDGIIWEDDYEDSAIYDFNNENLNAMKYINGGKYRNIYNANILNAKGHGKVLKMSTDTTSDRGFDIYIKDVLDLQSDYDINRGTIVIQQDLMIPSSIDFLEKDPEELYDFAYIYSSKALSGDIPRNMAYLFKASVAKDQNYGKIIFQTGLPPDIIEESSHNVKVIDFDQWYNIEVVINYDAGIVSYYVDGDLITVYQGSPENVLKYFQLAYLGLKQCGEYTESINPVTFMWDNFKIMQPPKTLTAAVSNHGKDYVDICFSMPVSEYALNKSLAYVKVKGYNQINNFIKVEKQGAFHARYYFNMNFMWPNIYEMVLSDVYSAYGKTPLGEDTKIVFSGNTNPVGKVLIDMDFEDVNINSTNSSEFNDFYLIRQKSRDDITFEGDKQWTYYYAKINSDNNGGKQLEYDHFLNWDGMVRNGLKFPFRDQDGKQVTINKGIINIEFDTGVKGEAMRSRFLFGLNDPNKNDTTWTTATVFGGLSPYDGEKLTFSKPTSMYRTRLESDSGMDVTLALSNIGEMHHYKYIINIDNSSYQIYCDDCLVADLDYIPGGAKDNSFDAFIVSGIYYNNYIPDNQKTFIMLDNLKVTAIEEPNVSQAEGLGVWIGGQELMSDNPIYENEGIRGEYDSNTRTLTLRGNGVITGADNINHGGAGIFSEHNITIRLDNADITVNSGATTGWSSGIYTYGENAYLNIEGSGSLTVNASDVKNSGADAITAWSTSDLKGSNGSWINDGYAVALKGDNLIIEANGKAGGVGLHAVQKDGGWLRYQNDVTIKAKGDKQAINAENGCVEYIDDNYNETFHCYVKELIKDGKLYTYFTPLTQEKLEDCLSISIIPYKE